MEATTQMKELLVEEVKDLYSAEKQLMKALPKMAAAASSAELKQAFDSHFEETAHQVSRLEKAAELLNAKAGGKRCKGMEGLIEEGNEAITEHADSEVGDLALIGAASRIEHYEIAGYGSALELARSIGSDEVVQLLTESFQEENAAEEELRSQSSALMDSKSATTKSRNGKYTPKTTEYPDR